MQCPTAPQRGGSSSSPRLQLHSAVGQEMHAMGLLGLKVTAAPAQSHNVLGPTHRVGLGRWLTSYSLCFTMRNHVELVWGKNSLWGEIPPSIMCFPLHRCPIAGISNHGRQAFSLFLLLHTFGTRIAAVQVFLSDRTFRDFTRTRKPS